MRVAVAGSGPAGVAAAKGLLSSGFNVDILDFGNEAEPSSEELANRLRIGRATDEDFNQLRSHDVSQGFLNSAKMIIDSIRGRRVALDLESKKCLGSNFAVRDSEKWIPVEGAHTIRSLAKGGLSNIWGAACYPLKKSDFNAWPIDMEDLETHYSTVAGLLGINQINDRLADIYPLHGGETNVSEPTELTRSLLNHWEANGKILESKGILFGRSRLALRLKDDAGGIGCQRCGMCLFGCAYDAIYRADWTLSELLENPSFRYRKPLWIHRFEENGSSIRIYVRDPHKLSEECLEYDALFLATGTLSSLRIVVESQKLFNKYVPLVDNDLYLLPFWRKVSCSTTITQPPFTLNELAIYLEILNYPLHMQLYGMSERISDRFTGLLDWMPSYAKKMSERFLTNFIVAFLYLPGEVSAKMSASVRFGEPHSTVIINQRTSKVSKMILRKTIAHFFKNRQALGIMPLLQTIPSTPAGPSGAHLCGTLPMSKKPGPLQTDKFGRVHGTRMVYAVDGSVIPHLPAQNSTFTIMANAHRIATDFGNGDNRD